MSRVSNVNWSIFNSKFNPNWMKLDNAAVRKTMVDGLKEYFLSAGKTKAVIGLSGGLDSSVAAQMAVEAFGADNVFGVGMPYLGNGEKLEENKDWCDARLFASSLEIHFLTRNITGQTNAAAYEAGINPYSSLTDEQINRLGNIKARQRMIMLYDVSAEFDGLVVGTGNRSEIIVGYCTLYGDTACAVNPLGDIYKTQLFEFAGHIEIPQNIIDRIPSAGLYEGQTDEGQMGFEYRELDPLGFLLFDMGLSREKTFEFGFSGDFVDGVIAMNQKNTFKFRLPPIISLPKQGE
jgi:NAD+ synthase